LYLFGYEFPDTCAIFAGGTLYVFANEKKLSYLQEAVALAATKGSVKLVLLNREKGDSSVPANRSALDTMLSAVTASGSKLGSFPSDVIEGPTVASWLDEVSRLSGLERVDASRGLEAFFAVYDASAQEDLRKVGALTARSMRQVLVGEFEEIVNQEKKMSNKEFSEACQAIVEDRSALEKKKVALDTDDYDCALPVCVQSGGEGSLAVLTPGAGITPSANTLSHDVIIMGLAVRYKAMRAGCVRTLMIDPTPKQCDVYDLIQRTHEALCSALKPGVIIGEAVAGVRDKLINEPHLPIEAALHKNFGTGVGLRLADKNLVLTTKNTTVIQPGMAFSITTGLRGIPMSDKHPVASAAMNKLETYSICLGDTVLVSQQGPIVLTEKSSRSRKECSYELAGDEEEDEEEGGDEGDEEEARRKRKASEGKAARAAQAAANLAAGRDQSGRSARLKEKMAVVDPDASAKREANQERFMARNALEAKNKGKKGEIGEPDDAEKAKEITAYLDVIEYPPRPRLNQIFVDKTRETVLIPWHGTLVPISILSIKSVMQQDEGGKHFLRINLYSPQGSLGKEAAPQIVGALERNPDSMYIKTLNFQSRDGKNFVAVETSIKAMLKRVRDRRKEDKEKDGLKEQPKVTPIKGSTKQIKDIDMWPSMGGRRTQGLLSCHTDGMIFRNNKTGEMCEFRYGNIKYAIYQPCEKEDRALIHFHLKEPILLNKKKCRDIQFFTQLVAVEGLEARGRNDYDPDEMGDEAQQRAFRQRINKEFFKFVRYVEDLAAQDTTNRGFTQFDTTQELDDSMNFLGVTATEMTRVHLAANCMFAVVDRPPMVVGISDIECVHFERVSMGGGGKSFDMILVLKEGVNEPGTPQFHKVGQIEMKKLEIIKDYLDQVAEVVFTDSLIPQQWDRLIRERVRAPDFWLREDAETGKEKLPGMLGVLHDIDELREQIEEEEEEEEEEYESEESEEESEDVSDSCSWIRSPNFTLSRNLFAPVNSDETPNHFFPLRTTMTLFLTRMKVTTTMMRMKMRMTKRMTGMNLRSRQRRRIKIESARGARRRRRISLRKRKSSTLYAFSRAV